jgi:hypothetical protein
VARALEAFGAGFILPESKIGSHVVSTRWLGLLAVVVMFAIVHITGVYRRLETSGRLPAGLGTVIAVSA